MTPGPSLTRRSFLACAAGACCSCLPLRGLNAALSSLVGTSSAGAGTTSAGASATSPAGAGEFDAKGLPTMLELGAEPMERIAQTAWVSRLAPGVWLHTTTGTIGSGGNVYFPTNGLLLERDNDSLLIDTGWTPEHAETLMGWAKQTLRLPVKLAVATHFHEDRTGGIPALDAAGIASLAHPLTRELARSRNEPVPSTAAQFVRNAAQVPGGCELYHPGAGHTRDNIVVWLPRQRVLFGGCFLKSSSSTDLGNLSDAVVADWAASVRRVRTRYPRPAAIVPGHGTIAGDAIERTLQLLEKLPA